MSHNYSNCIVYLFKSYHRDNAEFSVLPAFDDSEIDYLYEVGLGPMAFKVLNPVNMSRYAADVLKSSDLTAQVMHAEIRSASCDVLSAARRENVPVVPIKGVLIAKAYSVPHHRTMGDIDVLVPDDKADAFQRSLLNIGYESTSATAKPRTVSKHHHLAPLRYPGTGVVIEIHTALFSHVLMRNEPLYHPATLWSHTEPAEFEGISCQKFSPEFSFLYAVAHWAVDQKWAINVVSISDIVLMLNEHDCSLNWSYIDSLLAENPRTADFVAILLLFLRSTDLASIPQQINPRIENSVRRIGTFNMRVLHWLILNIPLTANGRLGRILTRSGAQVLWISLLKPRHKMLRLAVAVSSAVIHRIRLLLGSAFRSARKVLLMARSRR